MDIKELKFNSVFDVANCFKDEKNIKFFLMKFFEVAHSVNKKSYGRCNGIVKSKKFYNIDFELLTYAFFEFLKSENISALELAKVQVMFRKDDEDALKNNLFFLHVLVYFELVPAPKGSYFYLRTLHFDSVKDCYFSFNSVGLNEQALINFIGKEFLNEHINPMAENDSITTVAIGQKNVKMWMKANKISEKDVSKTQEFLG